MGSLHIPMVLLMVQHWKRGDEVNTCMCSIDHIGVVTYKWGAHGSAFHLVVVFVSKGEDYGGHYHAKDFEKD